MSTKVKVELIAALTARLELAKIESTDDKPDSIGYSDAKRNIGYLKQEIERVIGHVEMVKSNVAKKAVKLEEECRKIKNV